MGSVLTQRDSRGGPRRARTDDRRIKRADPYPCSVEFPCPSGPSCTATVPQEPVFAACTRPISGHRLFIANSKRAGRSAPAAIVLRAYAWACLGPPEIRRRCNRLPAPAARGRRASGPSLARSLSLPSPHPCPVSEGNKALGPAARPEGEGHRICDPVHARRGAEVPRVQLWTAAGHDPTGAVSHTPHHDSPCDAGALARSRSLCRLLLGSMW